MREQKQAFLTQILSDEARLRLGTIAAVKPERAEKLENIIITNAQRGAFNGKVSEAQLIDVLEQVAAAEGSTETETKVERAKHAFDSDDDIDIDNLDI